MTKADSAYSTRTPAPGQIPLPHAPNGLLTHDTHIISRRRVSGLLAALMATAGLSAGPARAAAGTGDDAELVALAGRWHRTRAAENAAKAELLALQAAFDAEAPEPRDVMRHRLDDVRLMLPIGRDTVIADDAAGSFYNVDEIEHFPYCPPPWDPADMPAAVARKAEISAEHERWMAERAGLMDRIGLTAAGEAYERASDERIALSTAIAEMPARTLAGLQAKANVAAELTAAELPIDHAQRNALVRSIIRDLAEVAHA